VLRAAGSKGRRTPAKRDRRACEIPQTPDPCVDNPVYPVIPVWKPSPAKTGHYVTSRARLTPDTTFRLESG